MIIRKSTKVRVATTKFSQKMKSRATMYDDAAWQKQRNSIARSQGYQCFQCNRKLRSEKFPDGARWQQHHRHHSNGASAQCALCEECHEKEHGREFVRR